MITIRDSHPDIMDFMRVKRNLKTVRFANISVKVSDALMQAVEKDGDFELNFVNDKVSVKKTVRAKEVWGELIRGARDWAEPGVIFWDTVKRESTSEYNGMEVISTNPCAEIPLEAYGDCCLGNINLSRFVEEEFTERSRVNWTGLERAARYGVRFLDNVLDYNADKHPLKQQTEASQLSRRIGVGFTGLGDMLCQMRLKYDTDEAIQFVDQLFERIKNFVYDESVNVGIEKGTFKNYDREKHLKSPFVQRLASSVIERIKQHGMRNVAVLTVPPVGSGASLGRYHERCGTYLRPGVHAPVGISQSGIFQSLSSARRAVSEDVRIERRCGIAGIFHYGAQDCGGKARAHAGHHSETY